MGKSRAGEFKILQIFSNFHILLSAVFPCLQDKRVGISNFHSLPYIQTFRKTKPFFKKLQLVQIKMCIA